MYKELIMWLRDQADLDRYYNGDGTRYEEAADAIEELQRLNAEITKRELKLRMQKPRWISIEEWLPEKAKEVYWCFTDAGAMCECRWTNDRFGMGASENWGWNIMDVPQYQQVTHWMPLPKPPKEENT